VLASIVQHQRTWFWHRQNALFSHIQIPSTQNLVLQTLPSTQKGRHGFFSNKNSRHQSENWCNANILNHIQIPPSHSHALGKTAISKTQRRHKPWFRPNFFLNPNNNQPKPTTCNQTRLQLRQTYPEKKRKKREKIKQTTVDPLPQS
jgi:hypothetical protein